MSDHNLYFFHLKWSTGKMGVDIKIDKKKNYKPIQNNQKGHKTNILLDVFGPP